ncbi:MAG: hypothetical protein K9G59_18950 [Caulobacter sp.]|nr:hypothetical protein [Caulobacter sp.]
MMNDNQETILVSDKKFHEACAAFREAEESTDGAVRDAEFRRPFSARGDFTSSQLDLSESLMPEFSEDINVLRKP